jgi:hypothetical protein
MPRNLRLYDTLERKQWENALEVDAIGDYVYLKQCTSAG